jgi:hypothetical protein
VRVALCRAGGRIDRHTRLMQSTWKITLDYLTAYLALTLLCAESVTLRLKSRLPLAKIVRTGQTLARYLVRVYRLAAGRAREQREHQYNNKSKNKYSGLQRNILRNWSYMLARILYHNLPRLSIISEHLDEW